MKEEKNTVNLHQEIAKIFERSLASIREETEREIREAQQEAFTDYTSDRRRFNDEKYEKPRQKLWRIESKTEGDLATSNPPGPQQGPLLRLVAGQHVFTSPHGE